MAKNHSDMRLRALETLVPRVVREQRRKPTREPAKPIALAGGPVALYARQPRNSLNDLAAAGRRAPDPKSDARGRYLAPPFRAQPSHPSGPDWGEILVSIELALPMSTMPSPYAEKSLMPHGS